MKNYPHATTAKNPSRVMPKMVKRSRKGYFLEMCINYGCGWLMTSNEPKMLLDNEKIMLFVTQNEPNMILDSLLGNSMLMEMSIETHYLDLYVDADTNRGDFNMILWDDYTDVDLWVTEDLSLSLSSVFPSKVWLL